MPKMDIRSFFKAKDGGGGAGKKKVEKSSSTAAEAAKKSKKEHQKQPGNGSAKAGASAVSSTGTSRRKVVPSDEPGSGKKPAAAAAAGGGGNQKKSGDTVKKEANKNSQKKRIVIDDSDEDDDEVDEVAQRQKPPPSKKEVISVDDDVAVVEQKDPSPSSSSWKKRKPVAASRDDGDDSNGGSRGRQAMSASDYFGNKKNAVSSSPKKKFRSDKSPPKEKKTGSEDEDEKEEEVGTRATRSSPRRTSPRSSRNSSSSRKREPPSSPPESEEEDDGIDGDDDDFIPSNEGANAKGKAASPAKRPRPTPPSTGKVTNSSKGAANAKKPPARPSPANSSKCGKGKAKRDPPLEPLRRDPGPIDTDRMAPECLGGYAFVFSGVLDGLGREDGQELIKVLGGRVTGAVSGKTDYLVVGQILEDGRPYTEGSKYKKAKELGTLVVEGEEALYGLIRQYDEKARGAAKKPAPSAAPAPAPAPSASAAATAKPAQVIAANPYARKIGGSNPYAKKSSSGGANPYAAAKKTGAGSSTAAAAAAAPVALKAAPDTAADDATNQLWVDKYKPASSSEIIGHLGEVNKLKAWLARWEDRFNTPQNFGKSFSGPNGPWKAAILSGPPGIGKTTTATIVAREQGRDVIEFNASDVRSKSALKSNMGDITGSRTIEFRGGNAKKTPPPTKRCIIMDEVDGVGGGDRGGIAELIQMIKHSRVPIICICNDRQSQKIKSLLPYCMDLRYKRPVKTTIANRAVAIAQREGLSVERNAAEAIVESCGNDIRQVINCLQMWSSNNRSDSKMTYKDLKERQHQINKDEILRVSLFDASKTICEGRRGLQANNASSKQELDHFFKRNDAFFVDYNFTGLIVQQNYLKVVQSSFNEAKRSKDQAEEQKVLERMHAAAESMSDFAHAENLLRGEQNWSLLPFTGVLTVKTGFHAGGPNGGFLSGYPEFTTWLGRNSTKGKKTRLLQELQHHANYHISGGTQDLRMSYLPVFRERLLPIVSGKEGQLEAAIELMDEYGLDRDDVFEKFDEFVLDPKAVRFDKIDSKRKAAFTRAYNEGVHKSQALVAEQGGGKKKGRSKAGGGGMAELADPDAIDDDKVPDEEDDEEEEELDATKVQALFKSKSRKGRGGGAAAKGKGKARKAPAKGGTKTKRTK